MNCLGQKHLLVQPLEAREISPEMLKWVGAFKDAGWEVRSAESNWAPSTPTPSVVCIFWPEWCVDRSGQEVLAASVQDFLSGLDVLRSRGALVVWHVQNLIPHETDSWGLLDRLMSEFILRVDLIGVRTEAAAAEIIRTYPSLRSAPYIVCGLGLYSEFYSTSTERAMSVRRSLGIPAGATVCGLIGLVRRYKNPETIVRAFRACAHHDDVLLIAGDARPNTLKTELSRVIQSDPRVVWLDRWLDDDELAAVVKACNFTVIASHLALSSATLNLSVSLGTPVLAPSRGEFRELAEVFGTDAVWLFEGSLTPESLRTALARARYAHPTEVTALETWDGCAARFAEFCEFHAGLRGDGGDAYSMRGR